MVFCRQWPATFDSPVSWLTSTGKLFTMFPDLHCGLQTTANVSQHFNLSLMQSTWWVTRNVANCQWTPPTHLLEAFLVVCSHSCLRISMPSRCSSGCWPGTETERGLTSTTHLNRTCNTMADWLQEKIHLIWGVLCLRLGPVLLTLLRHVARISANGIAAFKESCSPIG